MHLLAEMSWLQAIQLAITAISVLVAIAVWRRGGFRCYIEMEQIPQFYTSSRDFGVRIVVINRMTTPIKIDDAGVVLKGGRRVRYNVDWASKSSQPLVVSPLDSVRLEPNWPASSDNHYIEDVAQIYVHLADRRTLRRRVGRWTAIRWLFKRP